MDKTNAVRILEQKNIPHKVLTVQGSPTDGVSVAAMLGLPEEQVFKTLVTQGNDLNYYVFMVPVALTLDLKKAAKAAGVKSVAMIKQKELFPLTGYVHGGCSPIGMKKSFVTVCDETAILYDEIYFSAGRIGMQICTAPDTLAKVCGAAFLPLTL